MDVDLTGRPGYTNHSYQSRLCIHLWLNGCINSVSDHNGHLVITTMVAVGFGPLHHFGHKSSEYLHFKQLPALTFAGVLSVVLSTGFVAAHHAPYLLPIFIFDHCFTISHMNCGAWHGWGGGGGCRMQVVHAWGWGGTHRGWGWAVRSSDMRRRNRRGH